MQFNVKAIVVNKTGQFLALKRAYTNRKWDLPGGAVNLPELHDEALRREIQEETGLKVGDITVVDLQTAFSDAGAYIMVAAFKCPAATEVVSLSREHTDYRWLNRSQFLRIDATPYLKEIVRRTLQ